MRLYSALDDERPERIGKRKRYTRKTHKDTSYQQTSWSQEPMSHGGALLSFSVHFKADARRYTLELTPDESVSLYRSLARMLKQHPELVKE